MYAKILNRLLEKIGNQTLIEDLVNKLSMEELRSLLLEVIRQKVERITPDQLNRDFQKNLYVRTSDISLDKFLSLDQKLLSILPKGFQPVELSTMVPLGTSSVLGPVNQNNVISTIRNGEVISDATNVLALECAQRRARILKENPKSIKQIKLCSSQRQVRAQSFNDPNFTRHFKIFALCSAGRDEGNLKFEIEALNDHLNFYIRMIQNFIDLESLGSVKLKIFDYNEWNLENVINSITQLINQNPMIELKMESKSEFGKGYYTGMRFMIELKGKGRDAYDYIDGGYTDWTTKLLNNKKERLLSSGIGTELLLKTIKLKKTSKQ